MTQSYIFLSTVKYEKLFNKEWRVRKGEKCHKHFKIRHLAGMFL